MDFLREGGGPREFLTRARTRYHGACARISISTIVASPIAVSAPAASRATLFLCMVPIDVATFSPCAFLIVPSPAYLIVAGSTLQA